MLSKKHVIVLVSLISILVAGCSSQDVNHNSQPYAGLETRKIKALSEAKIDGLLEGKGLEYALAAELNHYPGPLHALELAKELVLSEQQEKELIKIKESVFNEAQILGKQLLDLEHQLDSAFANATITKEQLTNLTNQIAAIDAEIRSTHLKAHLDVKEILTPEQTIHYDEMRGYKESSNHDNRDNHKHGNEALGG